MKNNLDVQKKTKMTYTKDMLIKNIAELCGKNIVTVRAVYNALEDVIEKHLSSATLDTDVSLRLFEGVTIDSTFIPEKTKVNNLTGKVITTTSKIKPKANVTRYYCERLSSYIK